jgi:predicted transposase YbfD/YdcC
MKSKIYEDFEACFEQINDYRIDRKKLYSLHEILFLVLSGSICGCDSWRDYVDFGEMKINWLREHFEYAHGIPSKNTIARLFANLDISEFQKSFNRWSARLVKHFQGVIPIDGKTLCNSLDEDGKPIHIVSAFASHLNLMIAQEKVNSKSNEIKAIPELLDLFEVKGNIITIDAMGCQKEIAKKIIEKEGDYIFALKGNQKSLHEDVKLFLDTEKENKRNSKISSFHEEHDKGHGRIETRRCYVSDYIEWMHQKPEWAGFKAVILVEEERVIKGKVSKASRYFISSLAADAKKIAQSIRAHWAIENNLHWCLDVVFCEDYSTIHKKNAAENMAYIRRFDLNMLNYAKPHFKKDMSLKRLRKNAAWNNAVLNSILKQSF